MLCRLCPQGRSLHNELRISPGNSALALGAETPRPECDAVGARVAIQCGKLSCKVADGGAFSRSAADHHAGRLSGEFIQQLVLTAAADNEDAPQGFATERG